MSSLKLKHSGGNSMSIEAPATNPASNLALKLPATIGSANQFLKNSGTAGTLGWSSVVEDSSGRVGIGKSDPSAGRLVVTSSSNGGFGGSLVLENSNASDTDKVGIAFRPNGSATTAIGSYGESRIISEYNSGSTNGANHLQFHTHAGDGTVGERMRILSSGGITFNGDTASANALNDYEEGSWTPSLYNSGGLTVHSANYTKIGKLCNVNGYVTISTNSSSSALRFNSLPFTAANVGYFIGSAYTQNTGGTHVFTQIDGNSTNLTVYKNDGSTIYQSDVSGGYVLFSGTYRTT